MKWPFDIALAGADRDLSVVTKLSESANQWGDQRIDEIRRIKSKELLRPRSSGASPRHLIRRGKEEEFWWGEDREEWSRMTETKEQSPISGRWQMPRTDDRTSNLAERELEDIEALSMGVRGGKMKARSKWKMPIPMASRSLDQWPRLQKVGPCSKTQSTASLFENRAGEKYAMLRRWFKEEALAGWVHVEASHEELDENASGHNIIWH
jgi:hypothetical protein